MCRGLCTISVLFLFAACSSPRVQKEGSPPLLDPSVLGKPFRGPYPFVVAFPETVYYLTGPQQARPPDGSFQNGTRVALVLNAGSYSLVTSESGVTAYVSSGSLQLIE
uniref:Lipoprotein n=1 Tax=uncultured marine microorganism HF4000_APKG3D20 TaxID=455549 RepID=B3T796_9ZZZZ|nr:hypothetical protein ALOHA_HF4000APKG3D20ctg1g3 [uncultured marine microorganism HF4000_APKG3D20]